MGKSRDTIRVLVADDHAMFREGLCKLIEAEGDIRVVGQASNGQECLEMLETTKPDVLLLDLKMPEMDGLDVLSGLGGQDTKVRAILLTASEDERDFVEGVRRGARGVVLKQAASESLLEGIRKVNRGEMWIDQRVVAGVMDAMSRPDSASNQKRDLLTERELEIATLVTRGMRNKEIAEKLLISEQTVKNHLHNVYDKLGVSDRLELALYALHHQIVEK
jgi:DNA-binding NarL/FixJ family response regulator